MLRADNTYAVSGRVYSRHTPDTRYPKPDTLSLLLFVVCASAVSLPAEAPSREGTFLAPDAAAPAAGLPFVRKANDPGIVRGTGVVQWRQWNAETLSLAARARKPILVFVTATWCHWGKTMERATFTDMELATHANEDFIPVRLNRDERPDLDLRLQQAVQALSGRRGWPLTVGLTPDGRAFFGGTFFPADDDAAAGRFGLRQVLHDAMRAWGEQQAAVLREARALDDTLRKAGEEEETAGDVPADILARVAKATQAALDDKAGGLLAPGALGGGKFPAPRALELCLAHYARTRDVRSLDVVRKTLDAMLQGAIYDQLGGGWHRCCADRWWRVPRFEKLIAPNADMAALCAHAWQATGEARYKRAADETLAFWSSLQDPGGTYFGGSVAGGTSDLDEGDYYTWTVKELESVLRDDADARFAASYFNVREMGDLVTTAPYRNVLTVGRASPPAAVSAGGDARATLERLPRVTQLLREARARRPQPTVDRSIYVDGNALMAAAFIECGRVFKEPAYVARGVKTLRGLLKEGIVEAGALHVVTVGKLGTVTSFLAQDEAALAYACAVAFEATQEKEFADAAVASLQRLYRNFWDQEHGGYFDRCGASLKLAPLAWRMKVYQDTEQPATNALVAQACVRLGVLTGRKEFTERAASIVAAFGAALEQLGPYGATLVLAAGELLVTQRPTR